MRILNICVNADSYTDGLSYQDNLLPHYQKELGYEVFLLAPEYEIGESGQCQKSSRKEYVDENGIHIKRLSIIGNHEQTYRFKRFYEFYQNINTVNPDIIFCHSIQFLDYDLVIKYKRKHNSVKLYVDSHADFGNSAKNWISKNILHKVLWNCLAKRSIPYVEKFFGVTPARVEFLQEMYGIPESKTELLVMGADDMIVANTRSFTVRKKIRNDLYLSDEITMILAGGKIDDNKPEILELMRGFSNLSEKQYKLVVFGSVEDTYKTDFERLLVENKNISYVGWLNKEQIYCYFSAADLVVFPGLHSVMWEEAVGSGKPCVFRRISGFAHVDLGGNCAFFDDLSGRAMWNVIEQCTSGHRLEQMKRVAEEKGMKKFSYLEIAKQSIGEV